MMIHSHNLKIRYFGQYFFKMKIALVTFILFQFLASIKPIDGQRGGISTQEGEAFWELQDDMENWTAMQWDEWWENIEAQFGMQDEGFPEWNEQIHYKTTTEAPDHSIDLETSKHLRGDKHQKNGRSNPRFSQRK
jgi:hypothetical protein